MSGYLKRGTDPFPVHKLKRVDRPTTEIIDDKVQRVDERESGFNRAVGWAVKHSGLARSLASWADDFMG